MKNNEENPTDIVKLQQIAKDESLWLNIIFCLIDKIDLNDKLGPPVIAIFLEETPLPSKEQIILLTNKITFNESVINVNNTNNDEDDNKSNCSVNYYKYCEKIQRNILVILSCLVEKVAGTNVATLLADQTLDFTFNCLVND
jgi:RING finger and SPRY domain-containing protein 1